MTIPIVPLVFTIVGLVLYWFSAPNSKRSTVGKIIFAAAILVLLMQTFGKVMRF